MIVKSVKFHEWTLKIFRKYLNPKTSVYDYDEIVIVLCVILPDDFGWRGC